MCNADCITFGAMNLTTKDVEGKRILEVGSCNVNGSLKTLLSHLQPAVYTGVDICEGPGVDRVCEVGDLAKEFGNESFDIVISTEMIEHVRDWKTAITNIKAVLSPGGKLILTTRSKGFSYHGFPYDFWRFEIEDMKAIFPDFEILNLIKDDTSPGVLLAATKRGTAPVNLADIALYSVVLSRIAPEVSDRDIAVFRFKRAIFIMVESIIFFPAKSVRRLLKKLLQLNSI